MSLELLGKEHVPSTGSIVLPNRVDAEDLAALKRVFGTRKLTLLVDSSADYSPEVTAQLEKPDTPVVRFATEGLDMVPLQNAIDAVIAENGLAVFVPPKMAARKASVFEAPRGTTELLLSLGQPCAPLFIDHPREYALAVEPVRGNPERLFSFAPVLDGSAGSELTAPRVIQSLYWAWEKSYSARPLFNSHLGRQLIAGMKKFPKAKIQDGLDNSELPFAKLLAAAIALSKVVRDSTDKNRVGVVLPPGKGVFLANLAVILAGKVPVNINFTAGHNAIKSSMKQADLDRYVTADPFVRKMSSFPWPANRDMIFIERTLPGLKSKIAMWLALCKLLPATVIANMLKLPEQGGHKEALLLFTSGSSGEPKGVVLSHRNLLANVSQFSARIDLDPGHAILGCLPLFHSFGCTVTMWWPLLEGLNVVTYPSPLDASKLAPLIHKHDVSLLVSTPTFLRGYMRRVKKEEMAGLKYVVSGAEKLPPKFAEAFREKFGLEILEGYGLTETSPVSNVNLPDPTSSDTPVVCAARRGSVGQNMPGLAIRILDPDSGETLPPDSEGMIAFRGANIFEGYLNNRAKTEEVLQDGWFKTGDVGHMDADGFLHIGGRISRFSKIGGEMVPHETIENHIATAFQLETEDERKIAVVGIPDDAKGEQLVLLSTVASDAIKQEVIQLRYALIEMGIPTLWIPKKIARVEEIPTLASGKLDIKKCEEIASQV